MIDISGFVQFQQCFYIYLCYRNNIFEEWHFFWNFLFETKAARKILNDFTQLVFLIKVENILL